MPNVLITGASRGLGLEFTKQYAQAGWHVLAGCRNPENAEDLLQLATHFKDLISVHKLNVGNFHQIDELAASLDNQPLDILINNAGIYPDSPNQNFSDADYDAWLESFRINSLAPVKMAQAFTPHLKQGRIKKLINMTSKMGSIADNTSGGSYLYRSSKAALNAISKSLSIELAKDGITTLVLHPGWVLTDMGGPNALINAEQSVSGLRQVIDRATLADAGKFIAYDGQEIPW
ncbi:NAD(P)-dependent dehydrogenase, short-chain alcohol dehydrogenase family [Methylobacillus rhizosphaerae]|uniref:NAD(P)-dependent dehydrogenase, short-chain alcohol dehydrogenase family n=1 Tax=Methylobacillus rhizosphaerae TaxID=551994 RepID=A0A239AWV9_9PROT|nr:SDR family oxidoreductase [Methylobacillus rhizosphaerae]SNS00040.1 NAD(P)-dependent dehydrogenase, short-chain alcohol dehydrogenase family [Methylobacillus rhizosphaerae]